MPWVESGLNSSFLPLKGSVGGLSKLPRQKAIKVSIDVFYFLWVGFNKDKGMVLGGLRLCLGVGYVFK